MAFTSTNLHLHPVAPGENVFMYDAGSDTMATVLANGYFLNTDGNNIANLAAEDKILCDCTDGNMWVKVSQASTTAVSCQYAGGDLPVRTFATGTEAALAKAKVGFYEVGTSIATATRVVLPTPYSGAVVNVRKIGSGTQAIDFDAGASASDVSLAASDGAAGGGTGVVYNADNDRRITLRMEGEGFQVRGSSTSRWRIYALNLTSTGKDGSFAGEGASVSIGLGT